MTSSRRALRWCTPALVVLALAGSPATTAHAAIPSAVARGGLTARAETGEVVGGALLGRTGTVVLPAPGAPALPAGISAAAWVVADLATGDVLAARNAHGRFLPASTMKTLTAVALLPELRRGDVHRALFDDVNVEGSKVGLVPGERYRVDTLFQAMLMSSGNDAANSLATAAGGTARTVALMNATARRLGALDTVAANPSGLDAPEQLTSAYDLALITRAGMAMPSYRTYVGMRRSWVNAPGGRRFEINNHNKLLARYPGTTGGKTGYTVAARRTFVVTAKRGDRELVVTMLRAETMLPDATKLLDWGFAAAGRVQPVGTLVEPSTESTGDVPAATTERADRSGRSTVAGKRAGVLPEPAAVVAEGSRPPLKRMGLGALVLVVWIGMIIRRRQVRRRMYGPPSGLTLRLPVR